MVELTVPYRSSFVIVWYERVCCMLSRYTRFLRRGGVLVALFIASLLFTPVLAASLYQDGQQATLVLGQTNFSTVAAQAGQTGLDKPIDIAIDPITKKVFVADTYNHRVLRYGSFDSLVSGASAEAVLGQPNFTSKTASLTQNGMNLPQALVIDNNGALWVADTNHSRVLRFDAASSKTNGADADGVLGQANFTSSSLTLSGNRMFYPAGIAVDGIGTLWVADTMNHRVLRFDAAASKSDGAYADGVLGQTDFTSASVSTTPTPSGLYLPKALEVQGNTLWVADNSNHRVLRFNNARSKDNGAAADGVSASPTLLQRALLLMSTKSSRQTA